jgi:hypothetical protein
MSKPIQELKSVLSVELVAGALAVALLVVGTS